MEREPESRRLNSLDESEMSPWRSMNATCGSLLSPSVSARCRHTARHLVSLDVPRLQHPVSRLQGVVELNGGIDTATCLDRHISIRRRSESATKTRRPGARHKGQASSRRPVREISFAEDARRVDTGAAAAYQARLAGRRRGGFFGFLAGDGGR